MLVLSGLLVTTACRGDAQVPPELEVGNPGIADSSGELRCAQSFPHRQWTLEQRMAHHRVPAVSIAVIHDGEILSTCAMGRAAAQDDRFIDEDTRFQAASLSKVLTAFATLRLVDRGTLSLDRPVNQYLRTWKLPDTDAATSDSVTLGRLLSHRAGLNLFGFPGYPPDAAVPSLIQILDGEAPANTAPIRIVAPPGENWAYSGGGYLVLQQVLQDVVGQDFATLMDELVLTPIGMDQSSFRQLLPENPGIKIADGHYGDGTAVAGRWHIYPELAAAGLWTTATDLARFALAIQAAAKGGPKTLLTSESAVALTMPQSGGFSHGLFIRRNGEQAWFTHSGANEGFRALMYAYLTAGEGAVVMTNSDNGMDLAHEIIAGIAHRYRWPGFIPEQAR